MNGWSAVQVERPSSRRLVQNGPSSLAAWTAPTKLLERLLLQEQALQRWRSFTCSLEQSLGTLAPLHPSPHSGKSTAFCYTPLHRMTPRCSILCCIALQQRLRALLCVAQAVTMPIQHMCAPAHRTTQVFREYFSVAQVTTVTPASTSRAHSSMYRASAG